MTEWTNYNFGALANSGTADDLNTAFHKTDNNLKYLKERLNTFDNTTTTGSSVLVVDGVNIKFKPLISYSQQVIITDTPEHIIISVPESINGLIDDLSPTLSSDLDTNGYSIFNKVDGEYSNLKLNEIAISTVNNAVELFSDKSLVLKTNNSIIFSSDVNASGKNITCGNIVTDIITVTTSIDGVLTGDVYGNVFGNTTGVHTGSVIGDVSGTVDNISNHSIEGLYNVSTNVPAINQLLVWDGIHYIPTTLEELTVKAPLRLAQMTTIERDAITAVAGDMIYNTTDNAFQGYQNGVWVNLS